MRRNEKEEDEERRGFSTPRASPHNGKTSITRERGVRERGK